MQGFTEQLIEHGLRDRVLSELQLQRIAGGSDERRYGLVNRALKARELVRIRRGLYVLATKYRTDPVHPFSLAQAVQPGSYVSFETALSAQGWLPERVHVVASVVPGRKSSQLEHPSLGSFTFHPLALHKMHYLELVERQQLGTQAALVAQPVRALLDLITLRKLPWAGLAWLTDSLRVEEAMLRTITRSQVETLGAVYKHKQPNQFLQALAHELRLD